MATLDCSHSASLSIEFPRKECWSGLPLSTPRIFLPDAGIELPPPPYCLCCDRFYTSAAWEAQSTIFQYKMKILKITGQTTVWLMKFRSVKPPKRINKCKKSILRLITVKLLRSKRKEKKILKGMGTETKPYY